MEKIGEIIGRLHFRSPGYNRNLIVNILANNMLTHMEGYLDRKLNTEQYKGMIFCCEKSIFPRYDNDLRSILRNIGYLTLAQNVPSSEKIYAFLSQRIKEQIAKERQQDIGGKVKGSLSTGVASAEGEIHKNSKSVTERPETLVGIIEDYMQESVGKEIKSNLFSAPNLMLIITNADEYKSNDLIETTNSAFAAGTRKGQYACMTLVCSSHFTLDEIMQSASWFVFVPETVINDASKSIWHIHDKEYKRIFHDYDVMKKLLIRSKGSTGILREKWFTIFNNKDNLSRIYETDIP
jgi:hypothetical protein